MINKTELHLHTQGGLERCVWNVVLFLPFQMFVVPSTTMRAKSSNLSGMC